MVRGPHRGHLLPCRALVVLPGHDAAHPPAVVTGHDPGRALAALPGTPISAWHAAARALPPDHARHLDPCFHQDRALSSPPAPASRAGSGGLADGWDPRHREARSRRPPGPALCSWSLSASAWNCSPSRHDSVSNCDRGPRAVSRCPQAGRGGYGRSPPADRCSRLSDRGLPPARRHRPADPGGLMSQAAVPARLCR